MCKTKFLNQIYPELILFKSGKLFWDTLYLFGKSMKINIWFQSFVNMFLKEMWAALNYM